MREEEEGVNLSSVSVIEVAHRGRCCPALNRPETRTEGRMPKQTWDQRRWRSDPPETLRRGEERRERRVQSNRHQVKFTETKESLN